MKKVLSEIIYLLHLSGGSMNLLKLMKELYLIDRASIAERLTSVSFDSFYSMPHGPVLSATLNMLNDLENTEWGKVLTAVKSKYYPDIKLNASATEEDFIYLSEKDKEYIRAIYLQFKDYTPLKLEEYTHTLPEWRDPKGTSLKIHFADIMHALGKTDAEIKEAEELKILKQNLEGFV